MDSITDIKTAMEKSNFSLARTLIEKLLFDEKIKTAELYELYFDVLDKQSLPINPLHVLDYVDISLLVNLEKAITSINRIQDPVLKQSQRYILSEIKICERTGQVDKLYNLLHAYNIKSIERKNPIIPAEIENIIRKFFNEDFGFKLQKLSISIILNDLKTSEAILKDLIVSCFEKSSKKGRRDKLKNILEILELEESNQVFRIYKDLISFLLFEKSREVEFKRLVECIIYFDDFKFQVLILSVMDNLIPSSAKTFSQAVRENKNYDFVYLDKYFNHLKKYYVTFPKKEITEIEEKYSIDLENIEISDSLLVNNFIESVDEQEVYFVNQIRNEKYSVNTLIDFATTLLQSDCLYACEETLKLASNEALTVSDTLKVRYLYVTCLLKKRDLRASLDMILDTLPMCITENDLLSFLYAEAEVYIRLEENHNAIKVLKKIISIDSTYRLAKERLERLNEI